MWLKINYKSEEFENEFFKKNAIAVSVSTSTIAPVAKEDKSIRISKIFPLIENGDNNVDLQNCEIYFFDFDNPFRVLGKIKQKSKESLRKSTFFSYGTCSVIIFSNSPKIIEEFYSHISEKPNAFEKWEIKSGLIEDIKFERFEFQAINLPALIDYSSLPTQLQPIIDEFAVSIKIFESKVSINESYIVSVLEKLVDVVNNYINELVFLHNPSGKVPDTLYTQDSSRFQDPLERQIFIQQIVDRLIQIDTAISYVSTQMYSGSIPILERRSLIRRSSFLGIGSSIKTLNRVVDHIETAFYSINFIGIIEDIMSKSKPLPDLNITYNRKNWHSSNIDAYTYNVEGEENLKKLAYFSARQAFRESEYAITASLNSVSNGLSLEYSLMTITHEMLHSHARLILNSIFYEEDGSENENYQAFYEKYKNKVEGKITDNYYLIDSIREIIFTYCIKSIARGSLTLKKPYEANYNVYCPKIEDFYHIFQSEYRNVNEIFVHVLDLHYFYGGRLSKYIPLIWSSWSAVPHINADIRQYILRSLLAIASKIDQNPFERWKLAVEEFKEIIDQNSLLVQRIPLVSHLRKVLDDKELLDKYYFGAFMNSLIIVDLVMEIFHSTHIRAKLWDDENIVLQSNESSSEDEFSYNAPLDFIDIPVACPIPYLFDRMIKVLKNEEKIKDTERETAITILAMNSN